MDEAVRLLNLPGALIVAGGSRVVARGGHRARTIVDLGGLGLDYRADRQDGLYFGALTRLEQLIEGSAAGSGQQLLSAAARATSASWMVRNMATIGGELVERARYSAIPLAMLALDAELTIATADGRRRLPLHDFYSSSARGSREPFIVTEVCVPKVEASSLTAFHSLSQLPSQRFIAAVAIKTDVQSGRIRRARVALGGPLDEPQRLYTLEQLLVGVDVHDAERSFESVCPMGLADVEFSDDPGVLRGYGREMTHVVLRRTFAKLFQRAM